MKENTRTKITMMKGNKTTKSKQNVITINTALRFVREMDADCENCTVFIEHGGHVTAELVTTLPEK